MVTASRDTLIGTSARQSAYQHPVMRTEGKRPSKITGEKRRVPRYEIAIPALLEIKGDDLARITVTNISLAGFACDSGQIWQAGTRCWLKLPAMPQMPHFSMMEASVVRSDGDVMGCAFSYFLCPEELDPYLAEYQVAA